MKTLGNVLLIIIVAETSFGGGGRLFDTGVFSPRMLLFGLGVVYSVVMFLLNQRIPREFIFLMGGFITLSWASGMISLLSNQSIAAALIDFKPLAFFLLMPFFAITIRSINDVILISRIWKMSALILAVLYLIVMVIWKLNIVTTTQLVEWLNPTHDPKLEFYFRGETSFFFKALLYVGVGTFFFINEKKWYRTYVISILLLAIAMTMTRGMFLSVFIILSSWAFYYYKNSFKGLTIATGLLFIGIISVIWVNETLPSVKLSNAIRIHDLKAMVNSLTGVDDMAVQWHTVLFGHGFGATILGRQIIELTYANLFCKQGLVAIIFWLFPPAYIILRIRNILDSELRTVAMPYLMSTLLVYVVSFTNPFLTNSIGMSIVMIAMVAVRVVSKSSRTENFGNNPKACV